MTYIAARRKAGAVGLAATATLATAGLLAASLPAATAAPPVAAGPAAYAKGWSDLQEADPTTFTITETLKALETGKYTSVELVEAFLARIDTYEPYYNAFTQMNPDALADAAASDERRKKSNKDVGPLEGVPIVIKDSLDVKGMPTTSGWPLTSPISGGISLIPETDAPVVKRLRDAGAIFIGKTNLPILAGSGNNANNSAYGPTYNALNQEWAPGGSSSGSATSVAGGFAVAGMAEETGGSIQNPASAQSLYAVKPTFGLVPNTGNFPLAGLDPRRARPARQERRGRRARCWTCLAGYTPEDPKTEGAVVPDGRLHLAASPRTRSRASASVSTARAGASATTRAVPGDGGAVRRGRRRSSRHRARPWSRTRSPAPASPSCARQAAPPDGGNNWAIEQYLKRLGPSAAVHSIEELNAWADANGFENDTRINNMLGDVSVEPDLTPFLTNRDNYLRIFNQVMEEHDLDALVFPQQVREIGPIFGGSVSATTVSEINIAQLPGVVVPDGAYDSGKPFNLIFVDKKWSEAELLGYAYDFAEAYGGRIINRDLKTTPGPTAP